MAVNKHAVAKGAEVGARTVGGIVTLILKIIGTILLICITTGLIFMCIFAIYVKNSLSTELDVNLSDFSLAQTSTIYYYDDDSGQYRELAQLHMEENRVWVDYEDIPKYLEHAAVAIEDKRFYTHHGVDWYRTIAAFGNMFLSMSDTFGGSTLTQQLIKNVTQYDEVTVKRKLLEIFRALEFEKRYSKEEIIEAYLNRIYLGEGCYGVGSAAQMYFGKDVSELTLAECASLIGITNNPSMYDPYIDPEANIERQRIILSEMLDQGYITEAEYEQALAQELVFTSSDPDEPDEVRSEYYSWYVDVVIEDAIHDLMEAKDINYETAETLLHTAGYKIYAAIDMDIQEIVDEVYENRENLPDTYVHSDTQELQSAICIIDQYTGNVVALAGGLGEKDRDRAFNYATDALRPPGSTIKPLASYGPAIDLGYVYPYTTMNDSPDVVLSGTSWYPNNDTYTNAGLVTVKYAMQESINTIAAQLIDRITPQVSYQYLTEHFGISSLDPTNDVAYAPLALGQLTYGLSVRELANAYTAYANNGIYTESRTYTLILDANDNVVIDNQPESIAAVSEVTAYYITDMMQNVVSSGTGWLASLSNSPVAGKTGASNNWEDRWFIGYTPYYTAAVWTGYDTPEYMGSSNPAVSMWQQCMEEIHNQLEYRSFPVPENMRQVTVCIDSGLLATEICANDLRGNHTMTLYMANTAAPVSACDCHVWQEVCSESLWLMSDDCPADCATKVGVIDKSKITYSVLTPPYVNKETDRETPYIVGEMQPCYLHNLDPETGWLIDPDTGYLISPNNGFLYDMSTGKVYDPYSMWEIDYKTGMLIHPETGDLIDPWTGDVYVPETPITSDSPDVVDRPPGYESPSPSPSPSDTIPRPSETIPRPSESPSTTPDPGGETDNPDISPDLPPEESATPAPDTSEDPDVVPASYAA